MLVKRSDGVCSACGGQLRITDADDATMTVECVECLETCFVEPDAFGDGCMEYYVTVMTERKLREEA